MNKIALKTYDMDRIGIFCAIFNGSTVFDFLIGRKSTFDMRKVWIHWSWCPVQGRFSWKRRCPITYERAPVICKTRRFISSGRECYHSNEKKKMITMNSRVFTLQWSPSSSIRTFPDFLPDSASCIVSYTTWMTGKQKAWIEIKDSTWISPKSRAFLYNIFSTWRDITINEHKLPENFGAIACNQGQKNKTKIMKRTSLRTKGNVFQFKRVYIWQKLAFSHAKFMFTPWCKQQREVQIS